MYTCIRVYLLHMHTYDLRVPIGTRLYIIIYKLVNLYVVVLMYCSHMRIRKLNLVNIKNFVYIVIRITDSYHRHVVCCIKHLDYIHGIQGIYHIGHRSYVK